LSASTIPGAGIRHSAISAQLSSNRKPDQLRTVSTEPAAGHLMLLGEKLRFAINNDAVA